jgi:hypothetical protein
MDLLRIPANLHAGKAFFLPVMRFQGPVTPGARREIGEGNAIQGKEGALDEVPEHGGNGNAPHALLTLPGKMYKLNIPGSLPEPFIIRSPSSTTNNHFLE